MADSNFISNNRERLSKLVSKLNGTDDTYELRQKLNRQYRRNRLLKKAWITAMIGAFLLLIAIGLAVSL